MMSNNIEPRPNAFRLDRQRGKVMGVCAGISNKFGIDVTLLRVGLVIAVIAGFGLPVIAYLAIGLLAD